MWCKNQNKKCYQDNVLQITFENNELVKIFTIFNNVFQPFLAHYNKQNCTTDEIKDFLLDIDTIIVEHAHNKDIITDITIVDSWIDAKVLYKNPLS